MNDQKGGARQTDLIAPFVEIIHFVLINLSKLLLELLKYIYKIYKNDGFNEVVKIETKQKHSKLKTDHPMTIGVDTSSGEEITFPEINFKHHSFIVGSSGYGKTNLISLLQENTLRKKLPIIFFDPKGDIEAMDTFASICKQYNRKCYLFSEYLDDSINLNPLKEGSISQIVDRLMDSFDWSEQYYKEMSKDVLYDSIGKIKQSQKTLTLKNLYEVLKEKETKDNKGIIIKIRAILESDFGKKLSSINGISLYQVRRERACLYIGLSTQGHGETARGIGKLLFNELKNHSYQMMTSRENKRWAMANPIGVYVDEFGAIVQKDFIEIENKCRGAGIEITVAVQTMADIDVVDPNLKNQIIENTGNYFVLKQRLDENASYFSNAIGTILSKKMTYMTEDGEVSTKGTLRETQELIVHPDIIKNMNVGQCILLRQNPTQVHLINIRKRNQFVSVPKKKSNPKIFKELNIQNNKGALGGN